MGKIIRNGIEFSGTSDSANNINYDNSVSGLEARTAQEAIDQLNDSLGGLRFGTDGEGNYGYFGDDDVLVPFKSGFIFIGGMFHTAYVSSANYTYGFTIETHNTDVVDFSSNTITFKKSGKYKMIFVKGQLNTPFTIRLVINGTTIHTMSFGSNNEGKECEFNVNKGDALILKIDHPNTTNGWYDSTVVIV